MNLDDIKKFEDVIEWGKKKNLNYNFRVAKLQLAICYALKKEVGKVDEVLNSIMDIRDFPNLIKGIYYNLQALIYLKAKNYSSAKKCLQKQIKCYKGFGNSYLDKIKSNLVLVEKQPDKFSVKHKISRKNTKKIFYVESRF